MKRIHFETSTGPQSGLYFGDPDAPPALVFAHANGMCARAYAPLLARVAERSGKTVFGLDLRGHGQSGLSPLTAKTANWWDMARDYLAALEALKITQVALSGHSIGASLSLMVAVLAPKKITNLTLFDPVMMDRWLHFCTFLPLLDQVSRLHPLVGKAQSRQDVFDTKDAAADRWSQSKFFQSWEDGFFEAYVDGALRRTQDGTYRLNCPPHFEAHCFRQLKFWPRALVEKVHQPTRILIAETGSTLSKGVQGHIARRCPNFSVSTVSGTGHFLPFQATLKATDAMTATLM